jgi:hypothetical protein
MKINLFGVHFWKDVVFLRLLSGLFSSFFLLLLDVNMVAVAIRGVVVDVDAVVERPQDERFEVEEESKHCSIDHKAAEELDSCVSNEVAHRAHKLHGHNKVAVHGGRAAPLDGDSSFFFATFAAAAATASIVVWAAEP